MGTISKKDERRMFGGIVGCACLGLAVIVVVIVLLWKLAQWVFS